MTRYTAVLLGSKDSFDEIGGQQLVRLSNSWNELLYWAFSMLDRVFLPCIDSSSVFKSWHNNFSGLSRIRDHLSLCDLLRIKELYKPTHFPQIAHVLCIFSTCLVQIVYWIIYCNVKLYERWLAFEILQLDKFYKLRKSWLSFTDDLFVNRGTY